MKFFLIIFGILSFLTYTFAIKDPVCALEHSVSGPCGDFFPKFSYNVDKNECVRFIYGGCFGNKNQFRTEKDCRKRCVKMRMDIF